MTSVVFSDCSVAGTSISVTFFLFSVSLEVFSDVELLSEFVDVLFAS